MGTIGSAAHREPWNKGEIVGQKAPFKLKDIWALRVKLQMESRVRELALFQPAAAAVKAEGPRGLREGALRAALSWRGSRPVRAANVSWFWSRLSAMGRGRVKTRRATYSVRHRPSRSRRDRIPRSRQGSKDPRDCAADVFSHGLGRQRQFTRSNRSRSIDCAVAGNGDGPMPRPTNRPIRIGSTRRTA